MGYRIIPGHKKDDSNTGWNANTNLDEIVMNIQSGSCELNWYKSVGDKQSDTAKSFYSIPSPFATSYLFKEISCEPNNELSPEILELILCMIWDIIKKRAEIRIINKPDPKSDFYNFWDLAPDFIKFDNNDKLPVLMRDNEIIGGFSKYSYCWASPNYKPKYIILDHPSLKNIKNVSKGFIPLSKDDKDNIYAYLKFLQQKKEPELNFEKFWTSPILNEALKNIDDSKSSIYKQKEDCVVSFGVRDDVVEDAGFIKMNFYNELPEPELTRNIELFDANNKILFPLKQEFLKEFIKNGRGKFTGTAGVGSAEIILGNKKFNIDSSSITADYRSIAVWPPFKSEFLENYVYELFPDSDTQRYTNELEFFDEQGMQIKYELIDKKINSPDIIRAYRSREPKVFPSYIKVTHNNGTSGFVKVTSRTIKDNGKGIKIAVDFGTSHTTIACKTDGENSEKKLINFESCRPILIASNETYNRILDKFVPDKLLDYIPKREEDFENNIRNWIPFRTLFNQYNPLKDSFLEAGVIPLFGNNKEITNFIKRGVFKKDIKWKDEVQLRDGYLNYLTTLILVNCEGGGFKIKDCEIRWSFPKAFSTEEQHIMATYWNKLNVKLKQAVNTTKDIVIQNGLTESKAAMYYFRNNHKFATAENKYSVTIDIGGGTSDFSFFSPNDINNKTDLIFQNSIKFAGGELAENIKNIVITRVNQILQKPIISEDADYEEIMRTWPCVLPDWNNNIGNFKINNDSYPLFEELVTLFYSSLCFWSGLHLKREGKNRKLNQIAFGGNGSRFMLYFTLGADPNTQMMFIERFTSMFKKMAAAGQDIDPKENDTIEFIFTNKAKLEVAFGLLEATDNDFKALSSTDNTAADMLGLGVEMKDQKFSWGDWPDKDSMGYKITAGQIGTQKIDWKIFELFIDKFYKYFNETKGFDEYHIKRRLSNFPGFENSLRNAIQKRGDKTLATPLFFTALSVWMNFIRDNKCE